MRSIAILIAVSAFACKGKTATPAQTSSVGPLAIGGDYSTYKKVNKSPVQSIDHGRRFVDTYVNDIGYDAYTDSDEEKPFPEGTIIVKASWQNDQGQPSQIPGPTFVMKKMKAGYRPEHKDWYYAIHWPKPKGSFAKQHPQGIYWQSPDKKIDYCASCHNGFDRQVGLVPEDARTW